MWFDGVVLGIETSCDETSAALIRGEEVISLVVASQIEMHQKWGGVVPEAASRVHVESILAVIEEALQGQRPDAIAVTNRPGLVGALSVGVTAAKALALVWDVPLIGVHHLEGHLMSVDDLSFPHACLIVSGGHTELVVAEAPCVYRVAIETMDDAAGEAFDKSARLLGLPYPGGAELSRLADGGDPSRYPLPEGVRHDPTHWSFSGLKTAVLRLVQEQGAQLIAQDAAASIQRAIVEPLVRKSVTYVRDQGLSMLTVAGGVAANGLLRQRLADECRLKSIAFRKPELRLCTDNAAMIARAGSVRLARGDRDSPSLDVFASSSL